METLPLELPQISILSIFIIEQGDKTSKDMFSILINEAITWVIFQKTHLLGKNFM